MIGFYQTWTKSLSFSMVKNETWSIVSDNRLRALLLHHILSHLQLIARTNQTNLPTGFVVLWPANFEVSGTALFQLRFFQDQMLKNVGASQLRAAVEIAGTWKIGRNCWKQNAAHKEPAQELSIIDCLFRSKYQPKPFPTVYIESMSEDVSHRRPPTKASYPVIPHTLSHSTFTEITFFERSSCHEVRALDFWWERARSRKMQQINGDKSWLDISGCDVIEHSDINWAHDLAIASIKQADKTW